MDPNDNSTNPQNPNPVTPSAGLEPNSQPGTPTFNPPQPTAADQPAQTYSQSYPTTNQPVSSQPEPVPTWPLNQTSPSPFNQAPTTGFSPVNSFSNQPLQSTTGFDTNALPALAMTPANGPIMPSAVSEIESSPSFGNPVPSGNNFSSTPASFEPNPAQVGQVASTGESITAAMPGQTPSWATPAAPANSPSGWESTSTPSMTEPVATNLSSLASAPLMSAQDQPVVQATESAPTDLSHLVEPLNNGNQAANQVSLQQPESLVVPTTPATDTTSIISAGHSPSVPGWVFVLVGVFILLMVSGASAYFILGIGQPGSSTSIPLIQQSPLTNLKTLPTGGSSTPTPSSKVSGGLPVATPSSQVASSSALTPTGQQSALEILKKRQTGQ